MYADCCHYSSFFPAVLAKIGQDRGRQDGVFVLSHSALLGGRRKALRQVIASAVWLPDGCCWRSAMLHYGSMLLMRPGCACSNGRPFNLGLCIAAFFMQT
ncbi:unnamed protein product [Ostreobium quekettii]|uniref:Uncharacterized protein n=1 Tax=Ostreobium quekettii TaxID=121088 RepID=A0A8S1IR94_9CHLO|nr:unnamed protein product [Ostreobium quekettii]